MRQVKFNSFEKIAGLFVLIAIVGSLLSTVTVAIKKGWFASKVQYRVMLNSADGIHVGTPVHVSGIRAGSVTDITLVSSKEILVTFEVLDKFSKNIREDSVVRVLRPFVFGEKVIEVSIGSKEKKMLAKNSQLELEPTVDFMDLLSGKKLGPFLDTMEGLLVNLRVLAEAFSDPKRVDAFVKMFDKMNPLMNHLTQMSIEVAKMSKEFNRVLPEAIEKAPEFGKKLELLIGHMETLSKNLAPAFEKVGPDLPEASMRAIEALNESVILLKSMQKSFLLRSYVKEVKEEEKKRKPASHGK